MPHVCHRSGRCFIDNSLRRLLHDPEQVLRLCVRPGMTVMDVGCGMGLFSIAMARIVSD
jgi:2-polyprenyl-3-methyl-5-hydroxy-6-metoxy-1,4-benzoquinol methylase